MDLDNNLAKEKAIELYRRFDTIKFNGNDQFSYTDEYDYEVKQCAIACAEYLYKYTCSHCDEPYFWEQVKQEINKL